MMRQRVSQKHSTLGDDYCTKNLEPNLSLVFVFGKMKEITSTVTTIAIKLVFYVSFLLTVGITVIS